jgi:hypothetical protein
MLGEGETFETLEGNIEISDEPIATAMQCKTALTVGSRVQIPLWVIMYVRVSSMFVLCTQRP